MAFGDPKDFKFGSCVVNCHRFIDGWIDICKKDWGKQNFYLMQPI